MVRPTPVGKGREQGRRREELIGFRSDLRRCLTRWGDALFELCDATLCAPAGVGSVPSLSLEPVFRRSHGSLYKALDRGQIDVDSLRQLLIEHRPRAWPSVFAVDASTWDRCDAECSPERGFHYSASKHSAGQPIVAGWSYQWICQLSWAPDSWTAPVDVMRISPQMARLVADDRRYGTVTVTAWHGMHPKLSKRGHWTEYQVPPHRQGQRDPRRGRAPAQANGPGEEDALVVVVG